MAQGQWIKWPWWELQQFHYRNISTHVTDQACISRVLPISEDIEHLWLSWATSQVNPASGRGRKYSRQETKQVSCEPDKVFTSQRLTVHQFTLCLRSRGIKIAEDKSRHFTSSGQLPRILPFLRETTLWRKTWTRRETADGLRILKMKEFPIEKYILR